MRKPIKYELLNEIDKDILMYYKNDAFDTPERMRLRRLFKELMAKNL